MTKQVMELALEALEYHTAQTRPIAKTEKAIAALKEAIKQAGEPVAYWNGKGSIIPAEDVSYLPNWEDYYPIPLCRCAAAPSYQGDKP